MRHLNQGQKKHPFLCFVLLVWLAGCQLTLALRSDPAYLNTEVEHLPPWQPVAVSTKIILQDQINIDDSPHIYTSKAGTPFNITLPYSEMLNQAGHAAIDRWFRQSSNGGGDIYVSAKMIELFYYNHTDVGSNQPVIAVKLHVSVKLGNNIVHEGTYESGRVKGEKFGMTFLVGAGSTFEEYFSRAVYKAMLITLDMAMQDVSKSLLRLKRPENSHMNEASPILRTVS